MSNRRFKYALRWAKRNEKEILNKKLAEKLAVGNGKIFWQDVKKTMGKTRNIATSMNGITGDQNICDLWKGHYKSLLNCFPDREYNIGDVPADGTALISFTEIIDYINVVNITKSTGPDGVTAEHLKHAPMLLTHMLAFCFSAIFVHGKIPNEMLNVQLVPVVKDNRGKLSSMDNNSPIAMVYCVSKVFELCRLNRIEKYIKTVENQFGFKKKLGTDSCIFTLKEIIQKLKKNNTNTFLNFLDASKAFNRVRHDVLFLKLELAGAPKYIIRVLQYWYTTQLVSNWNGTVSDWSKEGCFRRTFLIFI